MAPTRPTGPTPQSMIQHVILHIGQSKTGTSSLQSFLARNRQALMRQGILYPDIMKHGMPIGAVTHNTVAESLSGIIRYPGLSAAEYFAQFREQCRRHQCHTLLLSGESFFGIPHVWTLEPGADYLAQYRAKLESLKKHLGTARCTVVVYLRRQDDWLESGIGQIIRYEGLLGRRVYSSDEQALELLSVHMDYAALLGLWDEVLAPEALIAVPYERERLQGGDVVRDFVTRTGLPLPAAAIETADEDNVSLDRRYLWLKNVINRIGRSKDEERVIVDRLTVLNSRLPVRRRWILADQLKALCRQRFVESNDRLAQRLGLAPTPFFSDAAAETPRAAARSGGSRVDSELEDGLAALFAFDEFYFSLDTRWIRTRTRLASSLRYDHPRLHAALKRVAGWAS